MKENIKIRVLMVENDKNQREMADILSISKVSFHNKISGKVQFTQNELLKLSDFFNVTVDYLVR